MSTLGSPLHVRGKDQFQVGYECDNRITPAYAGKSDRTDWTITCRKDHPRVCGEKGRPSAPYTDPQGSPPHARGKAVGVAAAPVVTGITPACAGKSHDGNSGKAGREDHPRMCGEKPDRSRFIMCRMGSPPHMPHSFVSQSTGSPPHVRGKDPVLHLRQCLQVRPDHARHLVHLSFLRA